MSSDGNRSEAREAGVAGTASPSRPGRSPGCFPRGDWSEEEYFSLATNRRVEYVDGFLEFLPMPTIFHQLIMQFLYEQLKTFVAADNLGLVILSGYKVRLRRKFREPDIMFIRAANRSRITKQYSERADLVMEIVSEENRATTLKRSVSSMPGPAFRNTGSWIRRRGQSPCWSRRHGNARTPCTARFKKARKPRRSLFRVSWSM